MYVCMYVCKFTMYTCLCMYITMYVTMCMYIYVYVCLFMNKFNGKNINFLISIQMLDIMRIVYIAMITLVLFVHKTHTVVMTISV